MIKGGKGGARTKTGLEFEGRVDLKSKFGALEDYVVKGDDLIYKGKTVAKFYKKGAIYKKLLKSLNIKVGLSKKLYPDETIFVISKNTLFVIEMKFQKTSGSVDEKLQTCDFKKKQYQKMLRGSGIKVEYVYILNDWYEHKQYKDTLDYIDSVGCRYFFETLPLKFLGLPTSKTKQTIQKDLS